MRFRLRTLLIVLALGPSLLAVSWWKYAAWKAERRAAEVERRQVFEFYIGLFR